MGLRVVAIGERGSDVRCPIFVFNALSDSGAEKKKLCLELGVEKWIDFKESTDLVKDIKDVCDGLGPHCALVTAATVRLFLSLK